MRFLSRLSTSGRSCCCQGLRSGSWGGCRGPQTPMSLLSPGERLVGAGRWAQSWVRVLALGVQGLFRSITPAPSTPAIPQQTPPASAFPLSSAEQRAGAFFSNGSLLMRKRRWKSLFQMCPAVRCGWSIQPCARLHREAGEPVKGAEHSLVRLWCHLVTHGGATGTGAAVSRWCLPRCPQRVPLRYHPAQF